MNAFIDLVVALRTRPWALSSNGLSSVIALVERSAFTASPDRSLTRRAGPPSGLGAKRGQVGRTAVISIIGYIEPRPSVFTMLGIGSAASDISRALRTALADSGVDRIVLDIDSPGGSVFGVDELASEIRAASATKPIIGIANSVAASAAYWIGSAATELYVTPGGQVGSIGIVAAHEDVSQSLKAAGVSITLITAGKHKAEGNPYGPLGSEARANLQAEVDSYGGDFTRAVARGRGVSVETVRRDMGQGRMLRGAAAVAAHMVDGVMTFDDVMAGARLGTAAGGRKTYAGMPRALARSLRELDISAS